MAVKKSAKKATTQKKVAKKTATQKNVAKKTVAKKATTQKTVAGKTSSKKTTAKKISAVQAESKPKGGVSSMSVNLGHVFQLRPRVNTSYRPADFMTAKQLLQDEAYTDVQEAARAVVDKALELTHKGSPLQRSKPR